VAPTKKAVPEVNPEKFDPLLTPAETAVRLRGTTVGTLAVWRSTKRYDLPFVRIGAKIFYRASAIEKFISERTTTETNHPRRKKAVR
jgi:hypothetical protein